MKFQYLVSGRTQNRVLLFIVLSMSGLIATHTHTYSYTYIHVNVWCCLCFFIRSLSLSSLSVPTHKHIQHFRQKICINCGWTKYNAAAMSEGDTCARTVGSCRDCVFIEKEKFKHKMKWNETKENKADSIREDHRCTRATGNDKVTWYVSRLSHTITKQNESNQSNPDAQRDKAPHSD